MDLIDIYRTFHPKAPEYTFFSSAHGSFSKRDHMVGQKISLNKFKKIENISSIFSDHNSMMLEINLNKKRKTQKHSHTWRLNCMLLNNEWVKTRLGKKSKPSWKQMKMNSQQPKTYGTEQRQS